MADHGHLNFPAWRPARPLLSRKKCCGGHPHNPEKPPRRPGEPPCPGLDPRKRQSIVLTRLPHIPRQFQMSASLPC